MTTAFELGQKRIALMNDYKAAFDAANPEKPRPAIYFENGWFIIGAFRYRKAGVERMIKTLRARVQEIIEGAETAMDKRS